MTDTANLGLPFIDGAQAQKHVTHNEALRILDAVIQISVLDSTLTAPPATPSDGERHIVAAGATGAWAGQTNAIAIWEDNAWRLVVPKIGWLVWSVADGGILVFGDSGWNAVITGGAASLDGVSHIGINTTASSPNLLSVRSNAVLFEAIESGDEGDGNVRIQLSKSSSANTSSMFFSNAFSGRAEFGLTGDDDFHLKVSADGSVWRDAMKFDATSGRVSFPSGGTRELLTADRYYFVRTDGADTNEGFTNSVGGAFRTLQHAYDVIASTLDLGGFTVTIQIVDGTYAPATGTSMLVVSKPWTGGGAVVIQGNAASPANVVISTTNADAIYVTASLPGSLTIKDLKIQTTTAGSGIWLNGPGSLLIGNLNFGACAGSHYQVNFPGAKITVISNYTISGGAQIHANISGQAVIEAGSATITLTGTPAFSVRFVNSIGASYLNFASATFSGAATGQRYGVFINGIIFSNGGSATFFPGNSVGVSATGGVYN